MERAKSGTTFCSSSLSTSDSRVKTYRRRERRRLGRDMDRMQREVGTWCRLLKERFAALSTVVADRSSCDELARLSALTTLCSSSAGAIIS
jgi:ribosomal protein L44E